MNTYKHTCTRLLTLYHTINLFASHFHCPAFSKDIFFRYSGRQTSKLLLPFLLISLSNCIIPLFIRVFFFFLFNKKNVFFSPCHFFITCVFLLAFLLYYILTRTFYLFVSSLICFVSIEEVVGIGGKMVRPGLFHIRQGTGIEKMSGSNLES